MRKAKTHYDCWDLSTLLSILVGVEGLEIIRYRDRPLIGIFRAAPGTNYYSRNCANLPSHFKNTCYQIYDSILGDIENGSLKIIGGKSEKASMLGKRFFIHHIASWWRKRKVFYAGLLASINRESPSIFDQKTLGAVKDGKSKNSSGKKSDEHHKKCREIAKKLWKEDPDVTIADMIICNEIVNCCDGHIYAEGTLTNWINDLCPNRKPGRRPKPQ